MSRPPDGNTCVKSCLATRLREPALQQILQEWVVEYSQQLQLGSLLVNRILLDCLNSSVDLPNLQSSTFFRQAIIPTCKSDPVVADNLAKFPLFPTLKPILCGTNIYTHASIQYATNFHNSLWTNFHRRQLLLIKQKVTKKQPWLVANAINDPDLPIDQLKLKAQQFVLTHRAKLKVKVTDGWLKKKQNIPILLQYAHYILTELKTKKFTLAPVYSIRRLMMRIDQTSAVALSRALKDDNPIPRLEDYFRLEAGCTSILTDGVSLVQCLQRENLSKPGNRASKSLTTTFKKRRKIRPVKRNPTRVIGIDPGRYNLASCVENTPTGPVSLVFSAKQNRAESGYHHTLRRTTNWEKPIQNIQEVFNQYTLKTSDLAEFDQWLQFYSDHWYPLWDQRTKLKYSRERFRSYHLKQKSMDRFLNRLEHQVPGEKPTIALGAATFAAGGRGEISAPAIERVLRRRFAVKRVDEYNTTRICNCCLTPIQSVRVHGSKYNLRSLVFCQQTHRLINRDLNAAQNILECFGQVRPSALTPSTKARAEVKLISNPRQGGLAERAPISYRLKI